MPVRLRRIFSGGQPRSLRRSGEGEGAGQDKRSDAKEFAQMAVILGLMIARHDIGAMEGDDARFAPALDKREQMDAGMAEINVHEVRATTAEDLHQALHLAAVVERREMADVLEPETANEVFARFARDHLDIGKGEALGGGALFGDDEGLVTPQPCNLPVDVKHLGLQEGGAVAGDDRQ